jgi:large subunit ribosomal protein L28e
VNPLETPSLKPIFPLQNKPAESTGRITFKSGQKRSLKKIKNVIKSNKYRADLQQAALRRASAIYRSQKTKPVKKGKAAAAAKKAE